MEFKKILVPTDFSDYSKAAIEHAAALARDTGAMLVIAHVAEHPEFQDSGFGGYPIGEDVESSKKLLSETAPADPSVSYSQKFLEGHAAEEIVRLAVEEEVDLIVMGTHGRRGLTRLIMGSVAEAVVRHAKCPVLTLKQPEAAASH